MWRYEHVKNLRIIFNKFREIIPYWEELKYEQQMITYLPELSKSNSNVKSLTKDFTKHWQIWEVTKPSTVMSNLKNYMKCFERKWKTYYIFLLKKIF